MCQAVVLKLALLYLATVSSDLPSSPLKHTLSLDSNPLTLLPSLLGGPWSRHLMFIIIPESHNSDQSADKNSLCEVRQLGQSLTARK